MGIERRIENIKADLASLEGRIAEIEIEFDSMREERQDWKTVLHDFIDENCDGGDITIALDTTSAMIEWKELAEALVYEATRFNNRNTSAICFSDKVEMYIKYLGTLPTSSILCGGSGDLLQLFEWIDINDLESPLIIFSDGIVYPTDPAGLTQLRDAIKDFSYPILHFFPSIAEYKRSVEDVNRVIDRLKITFMTE